MKEALSALFILSPQGIDKN